MPPKPGPRRRAGAISRQHAAAPAPPAPGPLRPVPARASAGARESAPLVGAQPAPRHGRAPPGPARGAQGRALRTEIVPSPAPPREHARPPPRWERSPDPATRPGPLRPAPHGAQCRRRGTVCAPLGKCIPGGRPVPRLSLGQDPHGPPTEGRPLPGSLGPGMRLGAGRTGRARGGPLGWPHGSARLPAPRSPASPERLPAARGRRRARAAQPGRWARVSLEGGRRPPAG